MGKFGHRNVVSENLSDYMIGLLGESGIGKSSTIVEVCHKEFGDDGYILFNMGKEQGIDAIDGAIYEDIEDWKKFDEVTKDIIKNKKTDYPDLKVVVIDTIDQALAISTAETIRRWNAENMGKKNFEPAKTLSACWGGFSAPLDYNVNLLLDKFWELKKVGVQVWIIGHVKTKEIIDPITGNTYSTLTTDISQRDFNAFKNKLHVVGIAYIDRNIETIDTGRKNIVNHKAITVNKVANEVRRISFRDDTYSVDSKSRLADIVSDIPLDADEFIKALKDAIRAAKKHDSTPAPAVTEYTPVQKTETVVEEKEEVPFDEDISPMNEPEDLAADEYPDGLEDIIRTEYKDLIVLKRKNDADAIRKIETITSLLKDENGNKIKLTDASDDILRSIYDAVIR